MADGRLGGDIPAMERLQGNLKQRSSEVQSLRSGLSSMITSTWWEGPAATRFKGAWEGEYKNSLMKLEQLLTDLSTEVNNRKNALVQVSQ